MSDQLVTTAPAASVLGTINAEHLISLAIERGASVEVLERMLAIRATLRDEAARNAYFAALADFQGDCPIIVKDKQVLNKDGRTVRYLYAPMESIIRQVGALLKNNGFSYRFETSSTDSAVLTTCIASHANGHSERTTFESKIDPTAFMNLAQKFGSALTFAKRYAFCNAFGIVTGDEDDDAAGTEEAAPESAREKLTRLRESEARKASMEPAEETPELSLLTDFLNGIANATDELELGSAVTHIQSMAEGKSKELARAAITKRADALGFKWSKAEGGFVKKGGAQ